MASAKRPVHKSSRMTEIELKHLDPRVRSEALRLAGGDASRVKVISSREAVVH